MNFFEKILVFLDGKMETPTWFGWFHIISLVLTALITAFLIIKFKDCSDRTLRKIIFGFWIVIIVLEIYKQLNFSFNSNSGEWNYGWGSFPYQFCSTPLYVLPLIVFLKQGKIRDALIAYTITYAFFAGLAVMIYPGDVYISTIGINIQTMFHHGSQVFLGVFLAVHQRKKYSKKFYLSAIIVFVVAVIIALTFNVIYHYASGGDNVNMFYIGPYQACTLPILNIIYPLVPWVVFILIYVVGFSLIAILVAYIQNLIYTKGKKIDGSKKE